MYLNNMKECLGFAVFYYAVTTYMYALNYVVTDSMILFSYRTVPEGGDIHLLSRELQLSEESEYVKLCHCCLMLITFTLTLALQESSVKLQR